MVESTTQYCTRIQHKNYNNAKKEILVNGRVCHPVLDNDTQHKNYKNTKARWVRAIGGVFTVQ
eukprot:scaffold2334_cov118-Cylindrotheca_fusiformis.AAC.8